MSNNQMLLNEIQDLYIAFYDRAADQGGLSYWAGVVQNDFNGNIGSILNFFVDQPEANSLYGTITSTNVVSVISQIYENLFNRAPDPGGLQYWENVYNTYHMSAGQLAYDILGGAQGSDTQVLYDKLQAANVFTSAMGLNYTSSDLPVAHNFLNGIGLNTDLNPITQTYVNNYVNGYFTSTYTLTTNLDTFVGANPNTNNFVGAYSTWTAGDSLTGLTGSINTLTLSDDRTLIDLYNQYNSSLPLTWDLNPINTSVSGIQTANITSFTAATIDTTGATAGTTAWTGLNTLNLTVSDYVSSTIYGVSSVTAAATTDVNFTDNNFNSFKVDNNINHSFNMIDTINGGKVVTVVENNVYNYVNSDAFYSAVTANGATGTSSVSVTQNLAANGDYYALVTIHDYNSTQTTPKLGTITTATLDGIGNAGANIADNALTTLTLNDVSDDQSINSSISIVKIYDNSSVSGVPTTLQLNVNNDTDTNLTEEDLNNNGQYTTLNVVTGSKTSDLTLEFSAVKTLNVYGNSTLKLDGTTPFTTVNVSGAAGFTAATLLASLTSITDSSSGSVNVLMPTATASFIGSTSTGLDMVTISAPLASTAFISGGSNAGNELVLNDSNTSTPVFANTSFSSYNVTGFTTLGIENAIGSSAGNVYNVSSLDNGAITSVDLQSVSNDSTNNTITFSNVGLTAANAATFSIDKSVNTVLYFDVTGSNGANDTLNLNLGASTPTVNSLFLQDSASTPNGIGTVNITVNNTATTIATLTDYNLSNLNLSGAGHLTIGTLHDGTDSLNITDNGTNSAGSSLTTLTDIGLNDLTLSGGHNFNIGTIGSASSSPYISSLTLSGEGNFTIDTLYNNMDTLAITDNGTSAAPNSITTLTDSALSDLTFAGAHDFNIGTLADNLPFADTLTITGASTSSTLNTIGTLTLSGISNTNVTLILNGDVGINGFSDGSGHTYLTDYAGFSLYADGDGTNSTAADNANINFALNDTNNNNILNSANTIALGNGNDTISLISLNESSVSSYTINNNITVGTGSNTINLTDSMTISGTITDTITFADNSGNINNLTAVNLLGSTPATDLSFDFSLIKPTGFAFDTAAISESSTTYTTLSAALADADSQIHTTYNAGYFTWSGNTYFFADGAHGAAVIELIGTHTATWTTGTTVHVAS